MKNLQAVCVRSKVFGNHICVNERKIQMQTVTLNIDGMTCGGCVKSVTRLLEGVEGVEKAEVSLENKKCSDYFR